MEDRALIRRAQPGAGSVARCAARGSRPRMAGPHASRTSTSSWPRRHAPPAPPFEVSAAMPCTAMLLATLPVGYESDWHPAPARRWFLQLAGELEVETGDGEVRRLTAGTVVLVEDVIGPGHRTRVAGARRARSSGSAAGRLDPRRLRLGGGCRPGAADDAASSSSATATWRPGPNGWRKHHSTIASATPGSRYSKATPTPPALGVADPLRRARRRPRPRPVRRRAAGRSAGGRRRRGDPRPPSRPSRLRSSTRAGAARPGAPGRVGGRQGDGEAVAEADVADAARPGHDRDHEGDVGGGPHHRDGVRARRQHPGRPSTWAAVW